ncbi:hypothetical protein [Liquorilactobacillus capillatus]|uniref:Uncharacterized protein n=1 Tax=Liquorilactobacillus capillatus DSM 19910 TaxID=1423731 RepID=A0A0R1M8W0_9LACO|nr:hypothetical protein [Liquorilactobacillus capillatus]KRL00515.1 hypothetical protein FC81_GL002047 [Liquorilactobacillus capillatus DSM 19910]
MSKEEILNYLDQKKALTADLQNARHDLYVANENSLATKKKSKKRLIWSLVVIAIVSIVGTNSIIRAILELACLALLGWVIVKWIQQGNQAKEQINTANQKIVDARNQPSYINGMKDFPEKFYSYWTIDRLMHLVQENRATTLQDAFNVAEAQDFQNDQLSLQQQNLAVAQSTNSMSKISAAANVFTAFNTRK